MKEFDRDPDFKWKPGFKVGAEFLFRCLNVEIDWTHFYGRAHFIDGEQRGRWKLNFDVIDLPFGYRYYPCARIYLKPFFGLRGARIYQRLNSHLEALQADATSSNITIIDMHDREKFWGIGPVVGLEFNWYMGCNFSLYFLADAVTYYGHINGKYFDKDTFPAVINDSRVKKSRCFNGLGTDCEIGIRWDKYICGCDNNCHFMLKLGLEQHRIYDFSYLGSDGSLTLDGGILEVGVGFLF